MSSLKDYHSYLIGRSKIGLIYRKYWVYPVLCEYLRGRVLDVGCGIGDFLSFRRDTIGVDINPYSVDYCAGLGLDARIMSNDRLPFPNSYFDGVVLDNVLEHLSDPTVLISEVRRVLCNNGSLIIGVPGRKGYSMDSDHKVFYDRFQLIAYAENNGFLVDDVRCMPFKSYWLDHRLKSYCVYGIFKSRKE